MVTTLRDMGLERVIVTGSGQSSLIDRIPEDFPGLFSTRLRITSRDVERGKPDPEPYLKAMELAGVKPWQSIVIENAPMGVEAGARSGAFTVGVTTGPIPADEMWRARRRCGLPLDARFRRPGRHSHLIPHTDSYLIEWTRHSSSPIP